MRNVFFLLLFLFIPAVCFAQQSFLIGVSGGITFAQTGKETYVKQNGPLRGYNGTVKGMIDFRKVQLGLGVEMGNIKGDMVRMVYLDYIDTHRVVQFRETDARMTGFYKAPHGFVHYKVNVTNKLYFFGGGMVGVLMGNSQLLKGKFNSFIYGVNAGIVMKIGNRFGLEIQEGWRHMRVEGMITPYTATNNMAVDRLPAFRTGHSISFFNTSIGMHIRMGK